MAGEKDTRGETQSTGWFLVSRCTGSGARRVLPLDIPPERPENAVMFDDVCLVHGNSPEALKTCTSRSVLVFVDGSTGLKESKSQAAAQATAILDAA